MIQSKESGLVGLPRAPEAKPQNETPPAAIADARRSGPGSADHALWTFDCC